MTGDDGMDVQQYKVLKELIVVLTVDPIELFSFLRMHILYRYVIVAYGVIITLGRWIKKKRWLRFTLIL